MKTRNLVQRQNLSQVTTRNSLTTYQTLIWVIAHIYSWIDPPPRHSKSFPRYRWVFYSLVNKPLWNTKTWHENFYSKTPYVQDVLQIFVHRTSNRKSYRNVPSIHTTFESNRRRTNSPNMVKVTQQSSGTFHWMYSEWLHNPCSVHELFTIKKRKSILKTLLTYVITKLLIYLITYTVLQTVVIYKLFTNEKRVHKEFGFRAWDDFHSFSPIRVFSVSKPYLRTEMMKWSTRTRSMKDSEWKE